MEREQAAAMAAAAGCLGIVAMAAIIERRQRKRPCGCGDTPAGDETNEEPGETFAGMLRWLADTDDVRSDDYTPTERLIAGVISTVPPYSTQHPERALPVARVALGAVAANRDATATVVAARVADALGPDALEDEHHLPTHGEGGTLPVVDDDEPCPPGPHAHHDGRVGGS